MRTNQFIAGMEEAVARLVSLALLLVFVLIFSLAKSENIVLGWQQVLFYVLILWLVYEVLAYILYSVFSFFSRTQSVSKTTEAEIITESQSLETSLEDEKN